MSNYNTPIKRRLNNSNVAVRANEAFVWCTGAVWHLYRTVLSGPAELVIPEHTRDAFFQLWCDLRTNVPKDRNWVRQHATALQPRTSVGYVALASFAAFITAGGTSFLCLALATLAALSYALVGVLVIVGLTAGFWLLVFSGVLFFSSFVIAWSASCLATGYVFLASTIAIITYIRGLISHRRTPLQESKRAIETVKQSSIAGSAPPSELDNSSHSSTSRIASLEDTRPRGYHLGDQFPDDVSPGRAQHLLGTADVNKTQEGMKSADAAAKGGPSVAGKPAAAVHPSILPNPQKPSPLLGAIGT